MKVYGKAQSIINICICSGYSGSAQGPAQGELVRAPGDRQGLLLLKNTVL